MRLLGTSAPGASEWTNALPSSTLGLGMTDQVFRVSCGLRLGAPVSFAHSCVCGAQSDTHGNHALVCKSIKSRFTRHQLGNDVIREAFRSAAIPSTLEPTGLLRNDGRRPDGLTMLPWHRGRSLAWDFTCANRLAASHSSKASQPGSTVATMKETLKRSHYSDLPEHVVFEPVSFETLGGIGEST